MVAGVESRPGFAFHAYAAALEREELASEQYQTLLEAAERMLVTP